MTHQAYRLQKSTARNIDNLSMFLSVADQPAASRPLWNRGVNGRLTA
jgi:hypothetical protein